MIIINDGLVDAEEYRIPQTGRPHLESGWDDLILDVGFVTETEDFSHERIQLSVELHVNAVRVTLNDVTKNVQPFFRV